MPQSFYYSMIGYTTFELLQVIIEYLEESPDASYEDLLNKIEVDVINIIIILYCT